MTYNDLVNQLEVYLQQLTPSVTFTTALPTMVGNAELRVYRELDFLATRQVNTSLSTTPNSRYIDFTTAGGTTIGGQPVAYNYPVVLQRASAFVPTATPPGWVDFLLVSLDFLDSAWPQSDAVTVGATTYPAVTSPPGQPFAYLAMIDYATAAIAPVPDAIYPLRLIGTWRPAPMSATQQTSWLGDNLPDLLFCAAMIEGFKLQRDVSDPKQVLPWENRYAEAKASALEEEQRRKGLGPSAQPFQPAPELVQTRG